MERSYADASLEEFEILTADPYVEVMKQKMQELADLVNNLSDVTTEERNEALKGLDKDWIFLHKTIGVTGNVMLPNVKTKNIELTYVEDAELTSNGFELIEEPVMIEGEVVASRYVPGFSLTEHYSGGFRTGCARFDQVVVEYPEESLQLIETRLRHFHADTMEEFDTHILNCANEDEGTLALAKLTIEIDPLLREDRQFLSDAQKYLTKILRYDADLPYRVEAEGRYYEKVGEGVRLINDGNNVAGYFKPYEVQFLPQHPKQAIPEGEKQKFVACIGGLCYSSDPTVAPVFLYLETSSLKQFTSLRRL